MTRAFQGLVWKSRGGQGEIASSGWTLCQFIRRVIFTRERNKMAESVSKSRKPKVEADKGEKFVPSSSATSPHPREELTTPPFSVQELRDCIPAHCFERSNLTSFTYLAVDLLIVSFFFVVGAWLHFKANMPFWLAVIVWPIYALVQVRLLLLVNDPCDGQNWCFSLRSDFPLLCLVKRPPTPRNAVGIYGTLSQWRNSWRPTLLDAFGSRGSSEALRQRPRGLCGVPR